MCKEEIVPSRVKFFARALNIRTPEMDVIGAPLREEDDGDANDILFTAIVNDLHMSETSRLTQRDIGDLQEFDMLPAAFIGDDREQRQVEFQVAEWAEAMGSDRGGDEGEDLEDEENERSEGEQATAAEEHSETTSARITQTRVPGVRVQLPPVLPTALDFPTAAGEVLDAQTLTESSTSNILPNEFAQQLPASIYDPTTLPTEVEQYRAELSAIIALEFEGVGEEVGRARRQRLRGDSHHGVRQPEMRERYSYEGPDALYRHWPPIPPAAVQELGSDAEMNDTAGLSRIPEEENEEVVFEDESESRSDDANRQNLHVNDCEDSVTVIADAVTISIAMAIAITVAVTIAVATLTTVSLLLFHRRWRRRR